MKAFRAILVACAVWGIVSPRMLLPCCGDTVSPAQSASDAPAEQSACSRCCDDTPTVAPDSDRPQDPASHNHPLPHSCTGCGLTCCAKVLIPSIPGIASLLLMETDVLCSGSDTLPSRLAADGIFRPPRSLT